MDSGVDPVPSKQDRETTPHDIDTPSGEIRRMRVSPYESVKSAYICFIFLIFIIIFIDWATPCEATRLSGDG